MVRLILLMAFCSTVEAQILGFGSGGESRLSTLTEKLKSLDMKADPAYEENFNQTVKALENTLEEEKLICSGEAANAEGKVLAPDRKQFCMRELKKQYLEAMDTIFNLKKRYLEVIHSRQLAKLTEIQTKLKSDLDKNF